MSILKILFVGVPEAVMGILVGLVVCRSSLERNNYPAFILKMLLSLVVILSIHYMTRSVFTSMVHHVCMSITIYILTFIFVWQMNIRQSVLGTSVSFFIMAFLDASTWPIFDAFAKRFYPDKFFEASIAFTPFLRVVHILIFFIFVKWNLRDSVLLNEKWSKLPNYLKLTVIVVVLSMLACVFSVGNYIDISYKVSNCGLDVSLISDNIQGFFIVSIVVFILILTLIFYVSQYLYAKMMLSIPPKQLIESIRKQSSKEELEQYIAILQQGVGGKEGER